MVTPTCTPSPFQGQLPPSWTSQQHTPNPMWKKQQDNRSLTQVHSDYSVHVTGFDQTFKGFPHFWKLHARNTCWNYQSNTSLPSALSIFSGFLPGFLPVFPSLTEDPVFLHRLACLLLFLLIATHSFFHLSQYCIRYILSPCAALQNTLQRWV